MSDSFLRTIEDFREEEAARLERETDPDMALVSDYVSGELDADREAEVRRRIATDPEFRALAEPLLAVYADRPALEYDRDDLARSWEEITRRIGIAANPPAPGDPAVVDFKRDVKRNRGRSARMIGWSVAALIMLTILPRAGAFVYHAREDAGRTAWNSTTTRPLADGSVAILGSRTRLVQIGDLASDAERWVVLDGEVTLTVKHIPGRSFIVRARSADIEVTGTRFTVRSYGEAETIVTVKEGSVRVKARALEGKRYVGTLDLIAGQTARVHRGFAPELVP